MLHGPLYGIPIHALASALAVARVDQNKFYLTDTLSGPLIGTLMSLGTAKYYRQANQEYLVAPHVGGDLVGLRLYYQF